jgi:hypothetical protein
VTSSPSEREQRIKELAHRIWESEGCPEGRAEQHWQMATRLVAAIERHRGGPLVDGPDAEQEPTS